MLHHSGLSNVQSARGLGWASIGIGLSEIAAPQAVQSMLGIADRKQHRGILRVLGVRELMHGISILTENRASHQMQTSLWARVAGDVLDTALLGAAAAKTKRPGSFAAVATMVSAIGVLDTLYAMRIEDQRKRRFSLSRLLHR